MSSFRLHPEVIKLPPIIEVEGIIIKQFPSNTPPTTSDNNGTIYMNNGVLTYKGTSGTISVIGNA